MTPKTPGVPLARMWMWIKAFLGMKITYGVNCDCGWEKADPYFDVECSKCGGSGVHVFKDVLWPKALERSWVLWIKP